MHFFLYFVALFVISCSGQSELKKSSVCTIRYGYLPISNSCDAYIECINYHASNKQCPDGLYFDVKGQWPTYPCGYPQDVSCRGRNVIQPANPTADCPHQYGLFPSPLADDKDCGHYRMCVEGRAMEMYCPSGLAYNDETARCDWPENVPTCKANDYLKFECPADTVDKYGYPINTNHRYGSDCKSFYSCETGTARLLSCDPGYAFDDTLGRCQPADRVVCK